MGGRLSVLNTVIIFYFFKVSDHYPVCFSLETLAHPKIQKNITTRMIISVEDKRFITSPPDQFLDEFSLKQYKARGLYAKDGQLTVIEVRSQRISNLSKVVSTVEALRKYDRSLVSYSVLASIKHQVMLLFSISRLGWQFDALFTKSDCQRIEKV